MDNMDEISRNSLNWEDFFGSSLELAPSLLNLYDHTIATEAGDKDTCDDHINDKTVSKTQSPPSQPDQDSFDEVQYRSQRLQLPQFPAERPVSMMNPELTTPKGSIELADNKKRPLSISSVSSTSMTSSPRLRKKRANQLSVDSTGIMKVDRQDSDSTLIPDCRPDSRIISSSESRQSVDSGCVEGEKNGDRYTDSVSVTSSETGSCKDEAENSTKDSSFISSPHVNRLNSSQLIRQIRGSDVCCPIPSSPAKANKSDYSSTAGIPSTEVLSPKRHARYITSLDPKNKSNSPLELHSVDINLPRTQQSSSNSPKYTCSSPSSLSHQEARTAFFSNYEDYTSQSFSLPVSVKEEKSEVSSGPQVTSHNDTSKVRQPSTQAPTAATETKNHHASPAQSPFHKNPPSPTSPTLRSEYRRDRLSQLSPTSEKASRRSERHGSVSKHERQSTISPRSGFSKVSKKRDSHAQSELGSKSTPVYVSYVSRVVTEIIESERIYIASLKDIIHGYMEPLEKILDSEEARRDTACLFSNIRDIYTFGCTFLSDLETACADPVKVAQCFVKYNKGFVIYTDYCTNYPRAVEVLTRFMQDPSLSQLCKERQHSLGHALPLGAYLLKPVQRILKYHLLLHNIVKNCDKDKEEAAILEKAFHHMTQMAHHINEMKRKHEHAVRIQEIQSQLEDYVGEDLTRLGELVLEGAFKVNGAKASRQVFLFERGLLISKLKEGGMLSCKTFIPCTNLMLIEVIPNDPLSFHIIPFDNPRAQDTLQARNMEQKRRWCHDIKQQILESFKGRIPDNAKNLIMQLGKDWEDDYLSRDTLDSGKRNQHNAPEYLEKRRFRRKSGSRLPDFSLLISQKTKKGGNKKNETQSEEKRSPRRSESRSPERHRRIFSKQSSAPKSRSRSISSSSISLPTSPFINLPDQPSTEPRCAITKPISKTIQHSSPNSTCPSPESPVYRKSPKKLIYSKEGTDAVEAERDIIKRPISFLMARTNPIISEDITNLLARCGGNFKMLSSPSLLNEHYGEFPGISRLRLGNICQNPEKIVDNNELKTAQTNTEVHNSEVIVSDSLSQVAGNATYPETSKHVCNLSAQKNVKESEQLKSTLISSPDLTNTSIDKSLDKTKEENKEGNELKSKHDLQGLESVYENLSMTEDHGGRRDMLNSASLRQRCKSEVTIDSEVERWRKEYEMMASGEIYKKNAGENTLLKKTSLRLPNTSKLLSARENELKLYKNKIRHKLTSSEETLSTGCVRDVSFLSENPLVVKSVHASSTLYANSKPPLSAASRPRGNSDLTEFMQISVNKENQLLRENISTPLYQCSGRKEHLEKEVKCLSQIPYATPPRGYMTTEKMRRAGSLRDTSRPEFLHQSIGDNLCSHTSPGAVCALSISPMAVTVAKPVSFNSCNLLRSKSTPISSERECSAAKVSPKERPVSMDVDKLTEESNKLIAEMEEYINNSYQNMKSFNKFPTSLSAMSVEEEEPHSNRLSMVSTMSTSSYESQGSSSSDGLVGTLKSKLRSWARMRNDSEYSYPSAVTSDDEEPEQTNSESGSAFGLQSKNMSLCRDDSDYDTALLEYTVSEPVSHMEHSSTPLSRKQSISSKYQEPSVGESHPGQKFSITDSYPCEDSSFIQSHLCDDPSFSDSHQCEDSSVTGSHICEDSVSESHLCGNSSVVELQPCEDYISESQLYKNAPSEAHPCEDYISESQLYKNAPSEAHPCEDSCIIETQSSRDYVTESYPSTAQLQPYTDHISESQICDNSLSESHPCEDSSTAQLQQYTDSVSESQPCDNYLSEFHPCEDSSTAQLQPCTDDISESQICDNSLSESHLCKDSSTAQLQPYTDYISESQPCDNSLSEFHSCEDSSVGRLKPCENSFISESHQQDSDDVDTALEKSKTSVETECQLGQIQFCHYHAVEANQIPSSSDNKSDIIQYCDPSLCLHCNHLRTRNSCSAFSNTVPKNGQNHLEKSFSVKSVPAEHLTELIKPVMENSLLETGGYNEQCVSDQDYCNNEIPIEGNLESESKVLENTDNHQQEDVEIEYPKKSIREFVQNFEEKQRAEAQKVLEVKRRGPGVMIRQRLKSLRESALHGWRISSPPSEECQVEHCSSPLPTHLNEISNDKSNDRREARALSSCINLVDSRDKLSKSIENLCKSQESINLSGIYLHAKPSISYSRHSIPFCNLQSNSPSHEKDICGFPYTNSDNQTSSGNQFIHRVHSGSVQSVSSVQSGLEPPSVPWAHSSVEPTSVPWAHSSVEPPSAPWAHSRVEPPSVPWAHSRVEPPSVPWAHSSVEPPSVPWAHSRIEPTSVPCAHSRVEPTSVPCAHSSVEPPSVPWAHSRVEPTSVPCAHSSVEPPSLPWAHSRVEPTSVPCAHSSVEPPSVPWAHSRVEPTSVPCAHSRVEPTSVPWAHSRVEPTSVPCAHSSVEPPSVPWAHSRVEPTSVPCAHSRVEPTSVPWAHSRVEPTSVPCAHSSVEPPSVPWTHSAMKASVLLPAIFPSTATGAASMQSSKPPSVFDGTDSEEDNLVKMKGWVRALISKFQDTDLI